jgi:hypothetical protein
MSHLWLCPAGRMAAAEAGVPYMAAGTGHNKQICEAKKTIKS